MSQPDVPRFEIVRPTMFNGWIVCHITFQGVRRRILASDAFPPFWSLLNFLRSIRTHSLPDHFHWEEEGPGAMFEAWPIPGRDDRVRLRVAHTWPDEEWVDAEFDAQVLIDAFLEPLRVFASWNIPAREHLAWCLTEIDIAAFEDRLPEGVQLGYSFHSRGAYLCRFCPPLPDDDDEIPDQAPTGEQAPSMPFPMLTRDEMLRMLEEYLATGHQYGPIEEGEGLEDPRSLPR